MPTVSIVNTDHYVLTVTIDTLSYTISKPTVFLASDEPYLYFNWSQFNKSKLIQNQFVIDFNDVTAPVCVSAADLLTQVEAFIYSPLSGGVTNVTATSPITSSGGATPDISTNINTNKLVGRHALGGGVMQEISIGSGVSIAGGTLNVTAVTSVGLTVPSPTSPALSVTGSPVTSSGTLAISANGVTSQYVRGDGSLASFPTSTGGGASVNYYFNGGTSQGTFGGNTYYQMSKTAAVGAPADFTIAADGYIAQFITDALDPSQLSIPAGNWIIRGYFSASSSGGSPSFYTELYKYDGAAFTLIASNSGSPEGITNGTTVDLYTTVLAVPTTALASTDRLAIRVYVTHSGKTITMYTQDARLFEVTTTFTTGITALNGLTAQVQSFATGTTGTDFGISSATATHTFNLPTASGTNRGALSSADWTTFNGKLGTALTSANIFVGNGSNVATGVAVTGDVTINNTGVTAIGNSKVTNAMLAGSIDLTAKVTGSLPIANGGTAGTTALSARTNIGANTIIDTMTLLGSAILGQTFDCSPMRVSNNVALVDGTLKFILLDPMPAGLTITGVKFFQGTNTGYTGDNENRVGLYSYSGGTLTLVASCANDANFWNNTANSTVTKPFSATYVTVANTAYYIGYIYNSSAGTAPTISFCTSLVVASIAVVDFTNSARLSANIASTTLATPQAMSGTTSYAGIPYFALY